jgi:hypothetical protein
MKQKAYNPSRPQKPTPIQSDELVIHVKEIPVEAMLSEFAELKENQTLPDLVEEPRAEKTEEEVKEIARMAFDSVMRDRPDYFTHITNPVFTSTHEIHGILCTLEEFDEHENSNTSDTRKREIRDTARARYKNQSS